MDPLLSKEEKNMREKMLQHEFPFDEKAWGAMKTLLEEQNKEKGGGVPAANAEPVPGPGKRWMWLLLLFFTLGLGAASMIWTTRPGKTAEIFNANTTTPSSKQPAETIHPSNNFPKAVQPANPANTGLFPTPVGQTNTALPTEKRLAATPKTNETMLGKPEAPSGAFTPAPTKVLPTETDQTTTAGQNDAANPALQPRILNLECLPTPLPAYLPAPTPVRAQPDTLVRPGKEVAHRMRRREHGLILGMNANAVDYDPVRLSILPHVGYFWNQRIANRTSIQVEGVLKYVTGYQLYVETIDILPTGLSSSTLRTNNLLYLEIPLTIKHKLRQKHSALLGMKPSFNYKVLSTGQSAAFNMDATREYTSQSGLRYFDMGLVLGWEYRLHKHWALDLRYNQGLLDLTFDQFYRDQSTHLNSDVQLSLRYVFGK
ncbi:MAG TPA: outer membrane beta-barrel protein [Saprospiraceae bacterium]|nr:outer membrane beta-barrel protein [Saprospiraceae bacterium]